MSRLYIVTLLFNLYAENIMRNAGLEEVQAEIKIPGEISITSDMQMTPPFGLKLNIQKTKIMASGPITSWQINRETMETVVDFILGGSKITADGDCGHEISFLNVER